MIYILGIITGLIIAIIVFLSVRRFQTPLERTAKRLENLTKQKGEVYYDTENDENLKDFIEGLPTES